ncbi:glycosyltransferase [Knoellia sp. S7-12]|uniref:glycosyltransferase n=1 Tax=Knoellia sp. S7-12 TaxID=3126698 RepID=UPI00336772DA
MAPINEYANEVRTLQGELQDAREAATKAHVQLLNAKALREGIEAQLRQELAQVRADLEVANKRVTNGWPVTAGRETATAPQPPKPAATPTVGASAMKATVNVGLGPDFFYGSQHHKDVRVLEHLALRNSSIRARDAIARSATNLLLDYNDIIRIAHAVQNGLIPREKAKEFRDWIPRSVLSLARVVADQNLIAQDQRDSIYLFRLANAIWGMNTFDSRAVLIYTDQLEAAREHAELEEIIKTAGLAESNPIQVALLRANVTTPSAGADEWMGELSEHYKSAGLSPIDLHMGDGDLLSRLNVPATAVDGGPLVTVMMPTHNGSRHILTAIESVLGQSWRNLELIVVDDSSKNSEWEALQTLAPADTRLKLIRLDSNQGAYRARLRAFAEARGEYVTVHDDDDWSHPQKIETQVQDLVSHPERVANMSYMTRIDEHGRFIRINDNPEFNQKNYSSLMIRRIEARRLGLWDELNRAADAEFHDRIHAATGQRVFAVVTPPLSFMRARTGSLTHGEIRKGGIDFARQTYGLFYQNWHKTIGQTGGGKVEFSAKERPFPIPNNLEPGQRQPDLPTLDAVYCTDLRFPGGNSSLTAAELRAMVADGMNVGIMHVASPVLRAPRPANPMIAEVVMELNIPVLAVEDSIHTRIAIVRNPSVLEYCDNLVSGVKADFVAVIANTAPMSINGTDACYDIAHAKLNAETLFRATATVFPESPQIRDILAAQDSSLEMSPTDWPGFLPQRRISLEPRRVMERKPRVGRHSRDHRLKWPDRPEDIVNAYVSDIFETRVLGGADSVKTTVDLEKLGVTVLPFGSQDPDQFLTEIDFWVYQHSRSLVESFGMATLEALAAGCIVVLPPYMERLFGSGAVYCEAQEIPNLVSQFWQRPDAFYAQSANAVSVASETFSDSAYLSRIRSILDRVRHD